MKAAMTEIKIFMIPPEKTDIRAEPVLLRYIYL
jgi:hypothetical protein